MVYSRICSYLTASVNEHGVVLLKSDLEDGVELLIYLESVVDSLKEFI